MIKALIVAVIGMAILATTGFADDLRRPWYDPPAGSSSTLPDNAKIQIYTGSSQTVTGAVIRTTPSDTPLSSQPISSANPYQRVAEFRNSAGVITSYITANGTLVLGTPVALAVTSVYPTNGATGVDIAAVPQVGTNIPFTATLSNLYVQGSSAAPVSSDGTFSPNAQLWNIPVTLSPGTTYTIKFLRQSIIQTTGETTRSCGTVMTDNAGVCESTFTTAP